MAITSDGAGNIVIDGEHILIFQLLALQGALSIEINTGLRHSRGSTMLEAAHMCGSSKRTKAGVWIDYVAWLASYGILPHGTERTSEKLSDAQKRELKRKLRVATAAYEAAQDQADKERQAAADEALSLLDA